MEQISFMNRGFKQNSITNPSLDELGHKEIMIREKNQERHDVISSENLKLDISSVTKR